ncbi:MAG: (Fe-S)-binding protein [Archaeoglobales archaeon]|nr:(Fe-S)-binding protein [Archaeoglobales archaeon]
MIDPSLIVDLLSKNVLETGNPLGVSNEKINNWWKETKIKSRGEWLFFTGMLYQLTPYIESLVSYLEKFENSKIQSILKFARYFRFLAFPTLKLVTPKRSVEESNEILKNIYSLLDSSVEVFYIPELDTYNGILLYDYGDDESFATHAKFVVKKLKEANIKKIVTADPHTTYALKVLYPKFTDADFEVRSYLELINPKKVSKNGEFVIHDPCYYGRYLEISDLVREKLKKTGINYKDVRYSKKLTNCCGGPIEALTPKISKAVAELRAKELGNSKILTMCPICLANLRRVNVDAIDISLVLCNESGRAE